MRHVSRKLTIDELARLFEGRTRFVRRLAEYGDPLRHARAVLRALPDDELLEALAAHPRIGEHPTSLVSGAEQGADDDPAVRGELARLNRAYEDRLGFRFVVFVNRRPRSEIIPVLRARLQRTREQELATAIDELVAIAKDRYRKKTRGKREKGRRKR